MTVRRIAADCRDVLATMQPAFAPAPAPEEKRVERERRDGGDDWLPPDLHPFIKGLLSELPPAKSAWSVEKRGDWLTAAAAVFKLIYSGDGTIDVKVRSPDSDKGSSE